MERKLLGRSDFFFFSRGYLHRRMTSSVLLGDSKTAGRVLFVETYTEQDDYDIDFQRHE